MSVKSAVPAQANPQSGGQQLQSFLQNPDRLFAGVNIAALQMNIEPLTNFRPVNQQRRIAALAAVGSADAFAELGRLGEDRRIKIERANWLWQMLNQQRVYSLLNHSLGAQQIMKIADTKPSE